MNFICNHIFNKIEQELRKKQAILRHNDYYYLDTPVKYTWFGTMGYINRIKCDQFARTILYNSSHNWPVSFTIIDGNALLTILGLLRENKFYIKESSNAIVRL